MDFSNVYVDERRAAAYDQLEFPGTYYLAFRDLPGLMARYVRGGHALDFGCGAGRSTRFLKQLGFTAVGADSSAEMLEHARRRDPGGEYVLTDVALHALGERNFKLVLAAFTFDNIPTAKEKLAYLSEIAGHLAPGGVFFNLVSSPEIYTHEWASFTTRDLPENRTARSGDQVKIVMTDVDDARPVVDVLWSEAAYRELYALAGLNVFELHRPLGLPEEPFAWKSETSVAPWTIYVLGKPDSDGEPLR